MLPNLRSLIKKHLPVLQSNSDLKNRFPQNSNSDLKNRFPQNSICTVFKRNRNLTEILFPSLYTKNKNEKKSSVIKKTVQSVIFVKII